MPHSPFICHLRLQQQIPCMGGLDDKPLLSHTSGGWTSEIQMSIGLVSSEVSVLGCLLPGSSCQLPHMCVCVLLSSSYKDTHWIGLGPTLRTSF